MSTPGVAGYPARVPDVRLSPLVGESRAVVECCELQWWFAVPQVGEQTRAAGYDRDTGELTCVRETAEPAVDAGLGDGTVVIDLDEWTREPDGDGSTTYQRISILAALTGAC